MDAQHTVMLTAFLQTQDDIGVEDPGATGEEALVDREHAQTVPRQHTTTRLAQLSNHPREQRVVRYEAA
ncbi:hypothetical protein GCM10022207_14910 [Streptomyces lannensis]|uniref:Uncharacterized protein n=1 Tax=Streptomyces lannensis TaxID=766498 RepID=A0ABP7JTC1_9ACTN